MNKDIVIGSAAAIAVASLAVVQASRGDLPGVAIDIVGLVIVYAATAGRASRGGRLDTPVRLSPGRRLIDPEEAEALGLTADARHLAEGGDE